MIVSLCAWASGKASGMTDFSTACSVYETSLLPPQHLLHRDLPAYEIKSVWVFTWSENKDGDV